MGALAFTLVMLGEALAWRLLEVVAIINNGMRRFGRAAALVLVGSAIRTLAAIGFWLVGDVSLVAWSTWYLAANALSALIAFGFFLPRLRLRFRPALYPRRMRDALGAGLADIVFYLQAELDKLLVLSLAGPRMAGLYAIAMRIIDLTAMPVRSFNQLVMQKAMVERAAPRGLWRRALNEVGIALVSVGALLAVIILLWWKPDLLGRNIGQAGSLLPVLVAVPALRNLTEYHAELLYAAERTVLRALLLAAVAMLKAGLIAAAIFALGPEGGWPAWLNMVFLATYVLSASVTYGALRPPRTAP
jgi:O-antigen/teichoic acid export membrane protein